MEFGEVVFLMEGVEDSMPRRDVRNSIYEKGFKEMARARCNAVEIRMSESHVRENLMHGGNEGAEDE